MDDDDNDGFHGMPFGELLIEEHQGTDPALIPGLPLTAIQGVTEEMAKGFREMFDARTIGQFGQLLPIRKIMIAADIPLTRLTLADIRPPEHSEPVTRQLTHAVFEEGTEL